MLAALTGGVYAMLRHRERTAGCLTMLASGVKLTAGLLLPFAIAADGRGRAREWRRDLVLGAAAGVAVCATIALAVFGTGSLHLLSTLNESQTKGDWHSIPGFISTRLGLAPVGHVASMLLALMFAVTFCWLVRRVWRGQMDWIDGAAWATVALLVTASSLLPWYVAWLMPLAALAADGRLLRISLTITAVVAGIQMLGYIPHANSLLGL
jgi:alpha-1,6-mannosyltransferase